MSEVRKFRWTTDRHNQGIPDDSGFDYDVTTGRTFSVTEGVREDIDPSRAELLKLLGLFPTLDVLLSWADNPEDDLQEVTV